MKPTDKTPQQGTTPAPQPQQQGQAPQKPQQGEPPVFKDWASI